MAPPPKPNAAGRIAALIERIGRLTRGVEFRAGLNPVQWETLRYLAVANRYSRRPAAVAEFLGLTRGTVSQTLLSLERKGLVGRRSHPSDGRVTMVELTRAGSGLVARDPANAIEDAAGALAAESQRHLADGLAALLTELQRRNGFRRFGQCATCRHFRRRGAVGEPNGPHRCGLTLEPLSDPDSVLICREHEARVA